MDIKKLQLAKNALKHDREGRIRGITRAGFISRFEDTESFLVNSINELWNLICDVADRKIDEELTKEAHRMIEEAKSILQ